MWQNGQLNENKNQSSTSDGIGIVLNFKLFKEV